MVKCADCGYLAVRSKNDYSLGEASIDFREKGAIALGTDEKGMNQHPLHEKIPLCFARYAYLGDAVKNITDKNNPFGEVKKIIQVENDCKEFTDWKQGFTPKEHGEMNNRKAMLKWQTEREEADKNWRMKESAENRKWRFLEFVVAVLAVVIVVVAAMIERGIILK